MAKARGVKRMNGGGTRVYAGTNEELADMAPRDGRADLLAVNNPGGRMGGDPGGDLEAAGSDAEADVAGLDRAAVHAPPPAAVAPAPGGSGVRPGEDAVLPEGPFATPTAQELRAFIKRVHLLSFVPGGQLYF